MVPDKAYHSTGGQGDVSNKGNSSSCIIINPECIKKQGKFWIFILKYKPTE